MEEEIVRETGSTDFQSSANAGEVRIRRFSKPFANGVFLDEPVLRPGLRTTIPFYFNRASIEEGAKLPLHSHLEKEIWIVTRGRGNLSIEGKRHELNTGDIVYFGSGMLHELTNTGLGPLELVSLYWHQGDSQ
jgi:mannose-6-phosphate isomerase-like protein (cupin superfamily)